MVKVYRVIAVSTLLFGLICELSFADESYRSPVDVVLSKTGDWLVTANESSHSISLVDVSTGKVQDELPVGDQPAAIALCRGGTHVVVSCSDIGLITIVKVRDEELVKVSEISVGDLPLGLAVSPDGKTGYVGLTAVGEVAELNLVEGKVVRNFAVGPWPRYLSLSPDGKTLAVACSGESKIAVVDTKTAVVLYKEKLTGGINIGHMRTSKDGKYVYFPWMVYRSNPITRDNIQRGWVLASRIGRVRLDGESYREAISLDVPRKAVADPHGLVLSHDERRLVVAASGTHELLVYRNPDLPYVGVGGPGDLIDRKLLADRDLFYRIDVGGRPMGMAIADDNRTVYVANYIRDSVQEVDIESKRITREIPLGGPTSPDLARKGMAIFYDGRRSLDQWYSCHTCHYNGGVNSKSMDTLNDGSTLTMKTVLPLYNVHDTSPWTWHGWQGDLSDAMDKSFTSTMKGPPINSDDKRAILAYLKTLKPPANPFRLQGGELSDSAKRGKLVFESKNASCTNCHTGEFFTDGKIHDVGLGAKEDRYDGFNTPTLIGVYRKVRLLHDGRAKSLEEVITDYHSPEKVSGNSALTPQEVTDLVAYLKSL